VQQKDSGNTENDVMLTQKEGEKSREIEGEMEER
jgi:hypothetical protein